MVRPRLAIAELALAAAVFVAAGVVIGAIGIATAERGELLGGA